MSEKKEVVKKKETKVEDGLKYYRTRAYDKSKNFQTEFSKCTEQQKKKIQDLKEVLKKHKSVASNYWMYKYWTDDTHCFRYLQFNSFNIDSAMKWIEKAIQWRESVKPNEIDLKKLYKEIKEIKVPESDIGVVFGYSKEGRPTLWLNMQEIYNWKGKWDVLLKLIILVFDDLQRSIPYGHYEMNMICDLENINLSFLPLVYQFGKRFVSTADHYPNMINAAILINSGKLIPKVWEVIKALKFVDPGTAKKYKFVNEKRDDIFALLDKDQIPKRFGGTAKFKFVAKDFLMDVKRFRKKHESSKKAFDAKLKK